MNLEGLIKRTICLFAAMLVLVLQLAPAPALAAGSTIPPASLGPKTLTGFGGVAGAHEFFLQPGSSWKGDLTGIGAGPTWSLVILDIDATGVTGPVDRFIYFNLQDADDGSHFKNIGINFYLDATGAGGGTLFQCYQQWTWEGQSSHGLNPGELTATDFDLRFDFTKENTGNGWTITPYFRLSGGVWTLFFGGSFTATVGGIDFDAGKLIVGFDGGADGTIGFSNYYLAGPASTVYVDDDWVGLSHGDAVQFPGETDYRTIGVDAFPAIQDGIDSVSGSTVKVAEGTYAPFTVDSKPLSIEGETGAVVTGNQTVTTTYGDRTTIIFLKNSSEVTLNGIKVQGPPSGTPRYGVIVEDASGSFSQGVISPNNVSEWSDGSAIGIWGTSDFDLTQDSVREFGKAGVFYYGPNASGQITDCVVEAPVLNDSLRLTNAVEADYGATVEVTNTQVFNSRNLHPDPAWASVGILSYGYGTPTALTVTNCYIYDNDYGGWAEDGSAAQSQINRNDIVGNIKYGVVNQEASVLNASGNWWGDYWGPAVGGKFAIENASAQPSTPDENVEMRSGREAELVPSSGKGLGTADAITENVAYSPWLGYAVGATPMTYLVDTTGEIQEGIDLAIEADSVRVTPGIYIENIVIDKPLALAGPGRDSVLVYTDSSDVGPPTGPSFQGSQMVIVEADDVLIDGFTFDGDNPSLTPPGTLDARNGIISNHTLGDWDGLTVTNCTVKNIYLRGIYASAQTSVTDIHLANNTVYNANGVSMQSAGIMLWGATGVLTHNQVTGASIGLFLHQASDGEVSFNSADSCELGIGVNGNDEATNLQNNRITDSNQGIQTIAINAEVSTVNDTVLGCKYGMVLYGLGTGFNTINDNLFDGQNAPYSLGFYISTNASPWGVGDVRGGLLNNQITNNWLGIVLNEPATDITKDVLVTIGGDSAYYNLIHQNDSSELYLEYCNNDVNATYNYWGKALDSQIEQEIFHQVDNPSLGLVDFSNPYRLGDANCDGLIDVADVIYLINYLFIDGSSPCIWILGDANQDGVIDVADVVYLINYLFIGGAPPGGSPPKTTKVSSEEARLSIPSSAYSVMK